jgi:hypothetical protein
MTEYQWVINQMNCVPQEGQLMDVVQTVHWTRTATTVVDEKPIFVSVYGSMACATPSETDFTAYPDLTYEQVCGWLDAGLDVPALDANLDQQIENIINPPIITLPLPWAAPTEALVEQSNDGVTE